MAKIGWKTKEQIEQENQQPISPIDKLIQEVENLKTRVTALESRTH
jgi:hypothetical protein